MKLFKIYYHEYIQLISNKYIFTKVSIFITQYSFYWVIKRILRYKYWITQINMQKIYSIQFCLWIYNIVELYVCYLFLITLYLTDSRVGRGNLVLRHSVPHKKIDGFFSRHCVLSGGSHAVLFFYLGARVKK